MSNDELAKLDAAWGATKPAAAMSDGFEPIPVDTVCEGVVIDQKPSRVGAKETPVCKVAMEVVTPEQYAGRWVFADLWITQNNAEYLMRDLRFLGWKGHRPSQLMAQTDASLMGCGAKFTVDQESYQKKTRETGELVFDAAGKPVMNVVNKVKFFTGPFVFKGKTKAAQKAEAKAAQDAVAAGAGDVPDDVPF